MNVIVHADEQENTKDSHKSNTKQVQMISRVTGIEREIRNFSSDGEGRHEFQISTNNHTSGRNFTLISPVDELV